MKFIKQNIRLIQISLLIIKDKFYKSKHESFSKKYF
jgi:hypothetical protein